MTTFAPRSTEASIADRDDLFGERVRRELMSAAESGPDALIASMDRHARLCEAAGLEVDPAFYLRVVPEITRDEEARFALVDLAFSSLERNGVGPSAARTELEVRFPVLAEDAAIAEASRAMARRTAESDVPSALPRPFSPPDPSGPRYTLEREIGRGPAGTVYAARSREGTGLPGAVAVKILAAPGSAAGDTEGPVVAAAERVRELRGLGLARVHEVGRATTGEVFIATDLAAGGSLQDLCDRGGPFSARQLVRLIRDAAEALDRAHRRGVIHGNIKPSNVLLSASDDAEMVSASITDFGSPSRIGQHFAELIGGTARSSAVTGSTRDDRLFVAPECRGGLEAPTTRSDIFSLGATLGYALRFAPAVKRADAERLSAIADLATSRDPEARHASAMELVREFDAWLEAREIARIDRTTPKRLVVWARRSPLAATLGGIAAVMLTAGGALWAVQREQTAFRSGVVRAKNELKDLMALHTLTWDTHNPMRDWISTSVLLDRIGDTGYFRDLTGDRTEAGLRAKEIRGHLDQLEDDGFADTLDWKVLSVELALHQLKTSELHADTAELLERGRAGFDGVLAADDPWLSMISTLESAQRVKAAVIEAGGPVSSDRLDELRPDYDALVAVLGSMSDGMTTRLSDAGRRDPVAILALRSVEHLSHEEGYGEADVRRWCEDQHLTGASFSAP